jgi:hypothetical protein
MRLMHAVAVFGALTMAGSIVAAQAPAAPQPPPTNLQVMPKDTPRAEVVTRMQAINLALGVTCAYCHKFEGPGNPANDFASDDKPTKNVARVMMRMTGEINTKLAAEVKKPADQLTRVGCMTCHRGAAIPVTPPPAPAPGRGGAAAPGPWHDATRDDTGGDDHAGHDAAGTLTTVAHVRSEVCGLQTSDFSLQILKVHGCFVA